jgi:hypothetical protein
MPAMKKGKKEEERKMNEKDSPCSLAKSFQVPNKRDMIQRA